MAQKQEKATSPAKMENTPGATQVSVKRSAPPVHALGKRHLWHLSDWEQELDRWFDDFRHRFARPRPSGFENRRLEKEVELQISAVDVFDQGDVVVVKAEIPGISKEELEVNLNDSLLTIKGEKRKEEEVKQEDYYRCERAFGSFVRTVELPAEVKGDEAKATFKNGVLEVRLPKTEEAKRKAVKVKIE